MMSRLVALVPMRHHSQRIPGKNYRNFAGKPLYHHIILSLMKCPEVTEITIDTDSPRILEDAIVHFPKVKLIERPEHLRADTTPMNEILLYDQSQVEADFYLQTHSTNPLLRTETISRAIQQFRNNYPAYDSLFSVTRLQTRLWDAQAKAINHDPAILLRTQDLPPVYEENSNLYIFTRKTIEAFHNRIGRRPLFFEIDRSEAVDIDEEIDFQIAECLYQGRKPS